jgi:two-component system NtrC family sensor kinase
MYLIQISIEMRITIGIAAMLLLFVSFLIAFITNERKKREYQENLRLMLEQKQEMLAKQNEVLETMVNERTAELNEQKTALQYSLAELKSTQQQLIQSEKMASLGEMTAGIAHEIQNPLNFVNNFSSVSIEIFEELNEELEKGNMEEARMITAELKGNLEKINHHGIRADKIVKSMLEHSRPGSGKRELTDMNELVKEAMELSLHNFRSKNKFVQIKSVFKPAANLPAIQVKPLDISRVIVNICNNALYAVNQKQIINVGNGFEPSIMVSTVLHPHFIEINIEDNGAGIPSAMAEKIFQPFFTTKPTGEGTGLGLSLSYDIITKGHGGTLKVQATENVGACFNILLPFE